MNSTGFKDFNITIFLRVIYIYIYIICTRICCVDRRVSVSMYKHMHEIACS